MALLNGDGALCRWLSAIRSGKASVSCSSIMDVSDCALISCDLLVESFIVLIMFLSVDSVGFR